MFQIIFRELTLNRFAPSLLIALLGAMALFLPACGGNQIKGQNPPETVLNSEPTPTPDMGEFYTPTPIAETAQVKKSDDSDTLTPPVSKKVARSYKQKIARMKATEAAVNAQVSPTSTPQVTPVVASVITPTVVPAPIQAQPPMESTTNSTPKKGSHWFLWLVVLVILGGGAYWYFTRNKDEETPYQPQPPVGGLSPVSGYTGLKRSSSSHKKTSIWNRKLF
jgi:hypothetical protein